MENAQGILNENHTTLRERKIPEGNHSFSKYTVLNMKTSKNKLVAKNVKKS